MAWQKTMTRATHKRDTLSEGIFNLLFKYYYDRPSDGTTYRLRDDTQPFTSL